MNITNHQMDRNLAARHGREAVTIGINGQYQSPAGKVVDIQDRVSASVKGTRSYPPEAALNEKSPGTNITVIEVINETTLSAAKRLLDTGHHPVILNFASATQPGGGFLVGALAQEEYLARSSCLYQCIHTNPMYAIHRAQNDPLYSNYALYSPGVPVIRGDDGVLLENPYSTAMITSPAANASRIDASRRREIGPAMWKRIVKVLAIGVTHGHDSIVLGAWGCGAFGNDAELIANIFQKALANNFNGAYQRVVFAILDRSPEQRIIGPFEKAFLAQP